MYLIGFVWIKKRDMQLAIAAPHLYYRFAFKKGDECISDITMGRVADLLLFTCCLAARPTATAIFKRGLSLSCPLLFFLSLLLPLYLFRCIYLFFSHPLPLCVLVPHPAVFPVFLSGKFVAFSL